MFLTTLKTKNYKTLLSLAYYTYSINIIHFDWIVFDLLYVSFMISENITFPSITSQKYEVDYFRIIVVNVDIQNIAKQATLHIIIQHHIFRLNCSGGHYIFFTVLENAMYPSTFLHKCEAEYIQHIVILYILIGLFLVFFTPFLQY